MRKIVFACIAAFAFSLNAHAETAVYSAKVQANFDMVYQSVHDSLENNRLFVVFQPDIGSNLSGFAKRWGDNYNRNKLDRIKSIVFCNPWYANEISNKDVRMMALCPLHLTMTQRGGETSINFVRPDMVARGSEAEPVAKELTELIIKAITEGIEAAEK